MTMQTAYPVFEASQVLTSRQLNDLTEYLEQQDRLSRRTLTGIGVVCGFEVDAQGGTVSIGKGVAVTSEGYLIAAGRQVYDRFLPYTLPVPAAGEATSEAIAEARYEFLFPDGNTQTPVFELFDTDYVPAPGDPQPTPLSDAFLANKTVMLFLECRLQSLKSCDINDCSDKGAERRFTLRRLLLTQAQADAMLEREAVIAQRPVDAHRHPRNELPALRIEKLALARTGVAGFGGLMARIMAIAFRLGAELPGALRDAYAAYDYLLGELYAPGDDPFPDSYFANLWDQVGSNLLLVQYLYDYMRDVAMAYNEFVQSAARFEAECLPDARRFPRHVLLGDADPAPQALAVSFDDADDVEAFDPLAASTSAGPLPRPAPRRTHFVASPAGRDRASLDELRALFLRMQLLALNFRLQGGLLAPIRLTPSRGGHAPLSERAIPFHYAITRDSQLFRNWSPRKLRERLLASIYAYPFSAPTDAHPLHFRLDDQDFIRIEGIVGKPLGSAMAELIAYKQALGLSFSIEPVFMQLAASPEDDEGKAVDDRSAATAADALRRMLLCRLSDLDVIFLILIGALFVLLVFLARSLGRLRPMAVLPEGEIAAGDRELALEFTATEQPAATAFFDRATASRFLRAVPREQEAELKIEAEALRGELQTRAFRTGEVIGRLNEESTADSAAAIYARVSDAAEGGNLFDRTRRFVLAQGGDDAAVQGAYAHTAMLDQIENLMGAMSVRSVADFDEERFATAYRGFAQSYENYTAVAGRTPVQDRAEAQAQAQILGAADAVTGQVSAFAAGNLQSEFTAALRGLFEDLTLAGFARRHPGLEHHAGVPEGGTFVMAYVSRADLEVQLRRILSANEENVKRTGDTLAAGRGRLRPDEAITEISAAAALRTDDALDDFVVLADFCLPYRCCDADCSDIELSKQIVARPFGEEVRPGPMAVPAVDGEEPRQPGPAAVATPVPARADISRLIREATGPLTTATAVVRGDVSGLPRRPGRFDPPPRPPVDPPAPDRDPTPPDRDPVSPVRDPEPRRPARGAARLTGVVGIRRGNTTMPLRNASLLIELPDGRQRRERTANGQFSLEVPAGELRIRGTAPGHRGRTQRLELRAGETRSLELIVTPAQ